MRMIHQSIWTSTSFLELDTTEKLLFIGLITSSDDYGKVDGNVKAIKAKIFPLEDVTFVEIDVMLNKIADTNGMILRYQVDKRDYIYLCKWETYQKVSHPTESIIPDPTGRKTRVSKPKTEKETIKQNITAKGIKDVIEIWNKIMKDKKIGNIISIDSGTPRFKHLQARFGEPSFVINYEKIFKFVAASQFCNGKNDKNWILSFDWLISNGGNYIKVLEDKYKDRITGKRTTLN